jgi:uncharacterized membrane protein YkvA (DUF1232 family)
MNPLQIYRSLIENPQTRMIVVVITLIYLFSPIDFIPDFIPILGQIDDGVLIIFLISALLQYAPKISIKKPDKPEDVIDVKTN